MPAGGVLGREVIGDTWRVDLAQLIYPLGEERKVANRTISNDFLKLEDTLAGVARPRGAASWVPAGASPGVDDARRT